MSGIEGRLSNFYLFLLSAESADKYSITLNCDDSFPLSSVQMLGPPRPSFEESFSEILYVVPCSEFLFFLPSILNVYVDGTCTHAQSGIIMETLDIIIKL